VSGGNTYTPTVDQPGLYVISVTNPANSCSNVDSAIVINNLNPAFAGFQYQTSGLTMIGTDISSGSGLSGWTWTFGDGNSSNDPNAVHTYATEGTYDVCLSVQNGCGASQLCQSVQVTFTGSVLSVDAQVQNVLCNSDSTGSVILQVNGGSGNYTYTWTGPNGVTFSTPTIENLVAGVYQLVVSDDSGNLFIGEYTVTEPTALLLLGSTVIDNQCFGQQNGYVSVDVTGGVGPFLYSFNAGPSQAENFIGNLPGGNVECVLTDANGCHFLAGPYTIQEPLEITYQPAIADVRCNGESNGSIDLVISGGVAPYTYLWNVGQNTTPGVQQLAAGQYICVVTDNSGCVREIVTDITQPDVIAVSNIQIVNASGPQHDNGSISIDVTGGTAPYVVSWSNGATGTSIQGLIPGEYTYSITDANGCALGTAAPITISESVSTDVIDWSSFISIAPNPSKGNVIVSWEGLKVEKGTMTLLSLDGRKLESRAIGSSTGNWDLSGLGLSSGVYVVLFEMNRQAVPFKLVVL
jgi:PKD repeat protein